MLNELFSFFPNPLRALIISYDPSISNYFNHTILNKKEWKNLFRECYNFSYTCDIDYYEYFKNKSKKRIFLSKSMEHHFLFLRPDNTLLAYGENYFGQLDNNLGFNMGGKKIQKIIKPCEKKIIETISVNNYSMILLEDGSVLASGFNQNGQLGFGDNKNRKEFQEIKSFPKNIETVYCKEFYILLKDNDGRLFISGNMNTLPKYLKTKSNSFVEIKNIPKGIDEIVCNCASLVIKTIEGDVYVAGDNKGCQLGISSKREHKFIRIKNIPKVDKIFGNDNVTLLLLKDGRIMTCGAIQTGDVEGDQTNEFIFVNNTPEKITNVHLTWRSILETRDKKFFLNPNTDREGNYKTKFYEQITNLPLNTIDIHVDDTKWPNTLLAFTSDCKIYISRHHHSKFEFFELKNAPKTISQIIYTRKGIVIEDFFGTIWTIDSEIGENAFVKLEIMDSSLSTT